MLDYEPAVLLQKGNPNTLTGEGCVKLVDGLPAEPLKSCCCCSGVKTLFRPRCPCCCWSTFMAKALAALRDPEPCNPELARGIGDSVA